MPLWNDEQEKPLAHIRVVDISIFLPGPYLSRLLAQYGAEVIKVEGLPEGDPLRRLKTSASFEVLNQGKRSVAIDFKQKAGAELVKRLAAESDVFIEGSCEGYLDELGLGYPELSELNPDLIYLSLRGLSGHSSRLPGHDLNFIAASGVGEWFLEEGHPNYSSTFGDYVGGIFPPAIKLLAHLSNPLRRGMHITNFIDQSFRSIFLTRAYDELRSENFQDDERKKFGLHKIVDGSFACSRYYRCSDAHWVALQAVQGDEWLRFCDLVNRPQWKEKDWDKSLVAEVEKMFLEKSSTHWENLAKNQSVCLFRVTPWTDHIQFSDARAQLQSDPFSWAGFAESPQLSKCPSLGQDTYSVLHTLGIENKEMAEWLSQKVIYQPEALSDSSIR